MRTSATGCWFSQAKKVPVMATRGWDWLMMRQILASLGEYAAVGVRSGRLTSAMTAWNPADSN